MSRACKATSASKHAKQSKLAGKQSSRARQGRRADEQARRARKANWARAKEKQNTMDQVMADLSSCPDCRPGDEVELFGPNIPVQEVAQKAGTIPWELFTGITPRVKRIYSG